MARGRGYVQNAAQRLAIARGRLSGGAAGGAGRGRGRGRAGASPMPFDSQAQRESSALGAETADTRSALGAAYAAAQNQLGFGTGASNPYSATAENKTSLEQSQRGITQGSGNQLYAGSTANAQSQARTGFDKAQKGIDEQISGAQTAFNEGTARAARDEALGMAGIKEGAIDRAAASTPKPLGVGLGRGRGAARGRGRVTEAQNVRRPAQARAMNAQARAINARINARGRGR